MRFPVTCAAISLLAASACSPSGPPAPIATGEPWPEADALFHQDVRWLGADASYSIDLGGDRSLWLFGDTFVATSDAHVRSESKLVRNTIGVQTGRDPTSASMAFFWGTAADGAPASFFAEDGDLWRWPLHGARLGGGPVVVFFSVLAPAPGEGLGFESAGFGAVVLDDPDTDPASWSPRAVEIPSNPFDVVVGGAVVRQDGWLIALGARSRGTHAGYLARFREDDLIAGAAEPEWWTGERGWVAQGELDGEPAVVMDDAGAECSLHFDARLGQWVHVASRGFGATTIAVQVADRIEGPYSSPTDAFTPPESMAEDPFVYAAKAHPEVAAGGDEIAVTYAANSFDFAALFTAEGQSLYWPRFVRISVDPAGP